MKTQLRQQVRQALARVSPADFQRRSRAICENVLKLDAFHRAREVMLYLPIVGEVDVSPLAVECWATGKATLAPTACDNCYSMRTFEIPSGDLDAFCPSHGFRQPLRHAREASPDVIDLVVVPALAYDERGNRLGRGGGFYDRFLGRTDLQAVKVGVAFDEQILPEVPMDNNDQPVDLVVTDRTVIDPQYQI